MKKLVALTLGSALIVGSTSFAFSDLGEEHWAYRNVMNMQSKGIVSGFEDNTFRPSDSLTREQFITMAVKGLNVEKPEILKEFDDISDRWSVEYILTGGSAMVNEEDISFRPSEVALREDVAMALVKINNLEKEEYNLDVLNNFIDKESISEERQKYVAIAVEKGFMSGNADGSFSPKKALTRAEGATVIFNVLSKVEANNEENVINWDGEYISNVDGLIKVKLTKRADTEVNFYIRGMKENIFGINNNATITGNTAKYVHDMFDEKSEFNFKFENSNLIIEVVGNEELSIFNGVYKLDDGSVSGIERTVEKNPLEGKYLLGEEYEVPEFESFEELEEFLASAPDCMVVEVTNMTTDTADFSIGGFIDGNMLAIMGGLEKVEGKWLYSDEDARIELEFKENEVIVTDTEGIATGIYSKKITNLDDEYKEYETYVDEIELEEGSLMY